MFTVDLGTGPVECEANLRALVAYEQAFGTDMVHDVFGRVEVGGPDDPAVIDFTAFPWTRAVKALWACAKARNAGVDDFDSWLAQFDGSRVDLLSLSAALVPGMRRGLFRTGAADS